MYSQASADDMKKAGDYTLEIYYINLRQQTTDPQQQRR